MEDEGYIKKFNFIVYTWNKNFDDMVLLVDILCKENDINSLIYLYNNYKDKFNDLSFYIISKSIIHNRFDIFKYFIECCDNLTDDDYECLFYQCMYFEDYEIAKYFIKNYSDVLDECIEFFKSHNIGEDIINSVC